MLDLGQDVGPVEVEEAEGFGLAVAEVLELDAELVLELPEQALLVDEDLFLGRLGGDEGAFDGRPDAPVEGLGAEPDGLGVGGGLQCAGPGPGRA